RGRSRRGSRSGNGGLRRGGRSAEAVGQTEHDGVDRMIALDAAAKIGVAAELVAIIRAHQPVVVQRVPQTGNALCGPGGILAAARHATGSDVTREAGNTEAGAEIGAPVAVWQEIVIQIGED